MRTIVSIGFTLALVGCQSEFVGGDHFFVQHEGADMPVWVTGNDDADQTLFIVHGGPGDTAFFYHLVPVVQNLEADYRIVYWDQRGAGSSQGNPKAETMTMDQMVEDANVVLDAVERRHGSLDVTVLGHSWGGGLGTAWLGGDPHPSVSSYIVLDGVVDGPGALAASREWVIAHAEDHKKQESWKDALAFYDDNPTITMDNVREHAGYVGDADGYVYTEAGQALMDSALGEAFASPITIGAMFVPSGLSNELDFVNLDMRDHLPLIDVPTVVFWGAHDGILPEQTGRDLFDEIGTAEKEFVLFEGSAHSPFLDEPKRFERETRRFLEGL